MTHNKIVQPSLSWLKDLGNCRKCNKQLLKTYSFYSKRGLRGKIIRYCLKCAKELYYI